MPILVVVVAVVVVVVIRVVLYGSCCIDPTRRPFLTCPSRPSQVTFDGDYAQLASDASKLEAFKQDVKEQTLAGLRVRYVFGFFSNW